MHACVHKDGRWKYNNWPIIRFFLYPVQRLVRLKLEMRKGGWGVDISSNKRTTETGLWTTDEWNACWPKVGLKQVNENVAKDDVESEREREGTRVMTEVVASGLSRVFQDLDVLSLCGVREISRTHSSWSWNCRHHRCWRGQPVVVNVQLSRVLDKQ